MSTGVRIQIFQPDSMSPRNDEQVSGGDGVRIHKDDSNLVFKDHAGLSLTSDNRAKHTLLGSSVNHR